MNKLLSLFFSFTALSAISQTASISGKLVDGEEKAVAFANVGLYQASDSTLIKVEASSESGSFTLHSLKAGQYFVVASFIGSGEARKNGISLADGQSLDVGTLTLAGPSIELDAATVSVDRALIEVQADRTIFNVDGTINSAGENAMTLMRKAPGVTVDNNDNINVLGRSGVMVYVDGKRLPLSGDDLSDYLKNIPSDQIDRIDIISNPGAKYDAEGNAGIIDIRLKKDKNLGDNGSVNANYTQGQRIRTNMSASGNHRSKKLNAFGQVGGNLGESFNNMGFENFQNGLLMDEINVTERKWTGVNYRLGTDFFLSDKHTLGFLIGGNVNNSENDGLNEIAISDAQGLVIDSILVANSITENANVNNTINLNYRFDDRETGRTVNIDLDYGTYNTQSEKFLPNRYYDATKDSLLTEVSNFFTTPTDISIYTGKVDYEDKLFGGKVGAGLKYSKVVSDNSFLVSDYVADDFTWFQNDTLSNTFKYDETVYAGYVEFSRKIKEKFSVSAGTRAELTDAVGDLQAFIPELSQDPVKQYYWRFFPSVGFTWQVKPTHVLALNYGRRINRPDYNVLNPFNMQLSQISYEKGNPRLQPEIVNNVEVGYTLAYRYNFKLAYSKTIDQITRLIGPDETDVRATFITWANLAEQTVLSFNASLPLQVTPKWGAYINLSASQIDNQADYGEGGVVDVQAFTYSLYMSHTIDLPWKLKGEISGYYSGPGVWGGVFLYESNWSLNMGLQRQFIKEQLNVKLSVNDIFYETGWSGYSDFNGLYGTGHGNWDSRFVSLSVGYNFGNQNIKSRKRNTGLEEEAGRVGG
jgi:iron complex outermembrane recepter protein